MDTTPILDRAPKDQCPEVSTNPGAVPDEKGSNWKSIAFATAKLFLRGVRDGADAFGPLKSVAGGLCFILENCEVWPLLCVSYLRGSQVPQRTKANTRAIESLARRIEALPGRLCRPIREGEVKEQERREKLGE